MFMHNYVKLAPGEKEEELVQKIMKQARRDPYRVHSGFMKARRQLRLSQPLLKPAGSRGNTP
ncbi:hypothetical protein L0337_37085, partial [candidate division KSB1 bacterium]|nr:hypothetical protein [candidate division KSB1 bacterium]